ncbi:MAG: hypothetical protein RL701_1310 [Pseudomonadota bacterium]
MLRWAAALALASFVWWSARDSGAHAAFPVGGQMPEVAATLADGSQFSLTTTSQVVVLNFWASYCGPCRAEAPLLSQTHAQATDVRVIGLSVEAFGSAQVARQAHQLGMHYPVGVADEALLSRLRVQSVPTTYVISKTGKIVLSRVGVLSSRELEAALEAARNAS